MINVVLFGPPGAGKGTQSEYLMKRYNLVYISTGNMLREEIENDTKIGREVKETINAGGLVSDEIIVQLIEQVIKKNNRAHGFLFDGFPRTYVQAYILDGLLQKLHTKLTCMLMLDVPKPMLIDRLMSREDNRDDDTNEVIQYRLKEYETKTVPVIDYYKEKNIFYQVDGTGSKEAIHNAIVEKVEKAVSRTLLNIIVYGYPGGGKGTQSKKLAKEFDLVYISIGRILRKERDKGTELGIRAKEYIDKGILVPDEIVIQLLETEIKMNPEAKGFVFKGFPRTLIQTYIMDGFIQKMKSSISSIVNLTTSPLTCIRRLEKRGHTVKSRPYDKSMDLILARLEEYEHKTLPVVDNFRLKNKVVDIDGERHPDEVFQDVKRTVNRAYKRIR